MGIVTVAVPALPAGNLFCLAIRRAVGSLPDAPVTRPFSSYVTVTVAAFFAPAAAGCVELVAGAGAGCEAVAGAAFSLAFRRASSRARASRSFRAASAASELAVVVLVWSALSAGWAPVPGCELA